MPATRRQTSHATLRVKVVQSLGSLLLLGACGLGVPSTAQAAQSLAPSAAESATPTTAAPRSYQPKSRETLDQVIEHTLTGSPLKIEILRQAYVAQNPQAFMPGKVPKLRKGVVLLVPDHEELLRIHLGARATPVVDPLQPARAAPPTVEERKRWVQFP